MKTVEKVILLLLVMLLLGASTTVYHDAANFGGPVSIGTLDGQLQTPISITGSTNSFLQIFIQNTNASTSASTDFIVGNDKSSASSTTNYGDFGINSSGNTDNIFGQAYDGYLYFATGVSNMVEGLQQTNGIWHLRIGGNTSTSDVLQCTSNTIAGQNGAVISGNGSGLTNTWSQLANGGKSGSLTSAGNFYGPGIGTASGTEVANRACVPFDCIATNLGVTIVVATGGSAMGVGTNATITLNYDGSATAETFICTGDGATVTFQDSGHSAVLAKGHAYSYTVQITTGGSTAAGAVVNIAQPVMKAP